VFAYEITGGLTWCFRVWKVRLWDVASGKELQCVQFSESIFVASTRTATSQRQHVLTAKGCTLLISNLEVLPDTEVGNGAAIVEQGSEPVACFRAPQTITSAGSHGPTICVGGEGGGVCFLQAPFLAA